MKNKRKSLSLDQLQVKSFVTSDEGNNMNTIKGGGPISGISVHVCPASIFNINCPPPPTENNCPQHTDHCPNTETIIGCPV